MEIATILGFVGWIVIITAIITGLRLGKGKKGRGIRTLQFTVSCFFIYVFVVSFFGVLAQGVMDFLAFLLFAVLLILPILGLRGFVKWYKNAPAAEEKTSQTEKQTLAPTPASEAEKQTPAPAASVELPGSAEPCAWAQDAEAAKWLSAIQKTWGVEVKPYRISEADARALESAQPMVLPTGVEQAQYAVEQSSNSVHWHPYGSWVDFKHTKFLYQGKLYYVNVCPTVQLTESMYNRSGDLSNMAKIMIALNKQAGPDRDQLVFVLDGNLHDQT